MLNKLEAPVDTARASEYAALGQVGKTIERLAASRPDPQEESGMVFQRNRARARVSVCAFFSIGSWLGLMLFFAGSTFSGCGSDRASSSVCEPGAITACYSGPSGTLGVGPCRSGSKTCLPDGSDYGPCTAEVTPNPEVCGTLEDDDCDGVANEEGPDCVCKPDTAAACYSGPQGTENVGACHGGTKRCNESGTAYGPCTGEVVPATETCTTAVDDDYDGRVNEEGSGCVCVPGSTFSCYSGPAGTQGVGICKGGTRTCNTLGTGYGSCLGEVTPGLDYCSTPEDENCDGSPTPCI